MLPRISLGRLLLKRAWRPKESVLATNTHCCSVCELPALCDGAAMVQISE